MDNEINVILKYADIMQNNPQLMEQFNKEMFANQFYNKPVGDVSQYRKPFDMRTTKYIQDTPDALGRYFEKTINAYDELANPYENVFNVKKKPEVIKKSITRGAKDFGDTLGIDELMDIIKTPALRGVALNILERGSLPLDILGTMYEYSNLNPANKDNYKNPIIQRGVGYME